MCIIGWLPQIGEGRDDPAASEAHRAQAARSGVLVAGVLHDYRETVYVPSAEATAASHLSGR